MISSILKHICRKTAPAIAGALALSVLVLGSTARAQSEQSSTGQTLEGTWRVQINLYNCSTGAPQSSFWSLLTFARGGTMTETTNNPALIGLRSPGHGFWSSTAPNTYTAASEAFIFYDVANTPIKMGTQKILQTITLLNANGWRTNDAKVKFFNTSGVNYLSGCANATAWRLTASQNQP
jgi:hypothetical protein